MTHNEVRQCRIAPQQVDTSEKKHTLWPRPDEAAHSGWRNNSTLAAKQKQQASKECFSFNTLLASSKGSHSHARVHTQQAQQQIAHHIRFCASCCDAPCKWTVTGAGGSKQ
jgi:hypothetical protein